MTPVRTSAPGKVVVCGEYAVLDGAPAVVMAIDRRASVTIEQRSGTRNSVTAPGFAESESQFSYTKQCGFEWHGVPANPLLESTWKLAGLETPEPVAVTLDTREFLEPDRGVKFGLGSSAALVAALARALSKLTGGEPDLEQLALIAHREFQAGKGSGVDVAASCHGGVIAYRTSGRPERLAWPDGVYFAILWSGVPADTKLRLEVFAARGAPGSTSQLCEAAETVLDSWNDRERLFSALREYVTALQRFSAGCDLGIFDSGHDLLGRMAHDCDVIYKPCGAGGGDIGIALAQNRQELRQFVTQAAANGFVELGLAIDSGGVRDEDQDRT